MFQLWQALGSITLQSDKWHYSEPVPNVIRLLRVRSVELPLSGSARFCLHLPDGHMNIAPFYPDSEPLIIDLPEPFTPFWRRVGLRGEALQGRWRVQLEYGNRRSFMPIANPSAPNYPVSTTAASTTIASATTSTAVLAANTARKGATVWNASTATMYLDLDAAASITDYAAKLDPGGYYEVPYGFTGALSGIWSAANGSALVREFT